MNDKDQRWGQLGRLLLRQAHLTDLEASRAEKGNQSSRAVFLARSELHWSLHQHEVHRAASRHRHLLEQAPLAAHTVPTLEHCSSAPLIQLTNSDDPDDVITTNIAHDEWRGFGAGMQLRAVHAYTDGSFDACAGTSSWAVTIANKWLDDNFGGVPSDESLVQPHHLTGAFMSGASIGCTQGIYPAELQAIARALAMLPASFMLHIHSDSESSIAAINSYELLTNERRRMRMAAHTLLQLIHHLLQVRKQAGGHASFHHVRAHTTNTDKHSVGNRLSDYQATRVRPVSIDAATESRPVSLRPLPLQQCEPHMYILDQSNHNTQIIDDVRQTAMRQLKRSSLDYWQRKIDGSEYFASQAALDTGRMVLRYGSAQHQSSFVHIVTNSIHRPWAPSMRAGTDRDTVQQLLCAECSVARPSTILTPEHVSECPSQLGVDYRDQLHDSIIQLLQRHRETAEWLRVNAVRMPHRQLSDTLLSLFPFPPSPTSAPVPMAIAIEHHRRHLTYAMCGILTSSQLTHAARAIGFDIASPFDRAKGLSVIRRLCLLCIDHLARLYSREKELALALA